MHETDPIFELIRKSEMNDWVGGSDPELVGDACHAILQRYLRLDGSSRLLDFGCGVGRVMLSVLKRQPPVSRITGFDIMPQVIRFGVEHITPAFPMASFELVQGNNDHYDDFIRAAGAAVAKSHEQLVAEHGAAFTGAYAFSVFTHVEKSDFGVLLKLLVHLIEPGGELLFTCFLLTPFSRYAITAGDCLFPFGSTAWEERDAVFIGNASDRLGFIAFDVALVEQMVFDAGLVITHVEHGSWPGSGFSSSLQDVVVCRRPRERSGAVQHVPTVPRPPRGGVA